jgi:hypothetical protein
LTPPARGKRSPGTGTDRSRFRRTSAGSAAARLPETYQNAKIAIEKCSRVDECKDWADKAEAIASYAKQAGDNTLRRCADRIQARAIQKCGELLKEIPAGKGGVVGGTHPQVGGRSQAARDAGLSVDQRKTALRVANVPKGGEAFPHHSQRATADRIPRR